MTQLEAQQYMYMQRQRQAQWRYVSNMQLVKYIQHRYIDVGVNPGKVPEIAKIYHALIGEYGEGVFNFENMDGILVKESDK